MSITHLKPLTSPVLPVDEDLIGGLEALLQQAKDGTIQGIAYVTIQSTGAGQCTLTGSGWRGEGVHNNVTTTMGAVLILQQRLLTEKV